MTLFFSGTSIPNGSIGTLKLSDDFGTTKVPSRLNKFGMYDSYAFKSDYDSTLWTKTQNTGTSAVTNGNLILDSTAGAGKYVSINSNFGKTLTAFPTQSIEVDLECTRNMSGIGIPENGLLSLSADSNDCACLCRDQATMTKWVLRTKDNVTASESAEITLDVTTRSKLKLELTATACNLYQDGTLLMTKSTNLPRSSVSILPGVTSRCGDGGATVTTTVYEIVQEFTPA